MCYPAAAPGVAASSGPPARPLGRRDFGAPRDLLPLPALREAAEWQGKARGRRLVQRVGRRQRLLHEANEAVAALNWCNGSPGFSSFDATQAQSESLRHVLQCVASEGSPPEGVTTQAAIDELLGGRFDYGGAGNIVAPYDPDALSLPSVGDAPVPLAKVLEGESLQRLVGFKQEMLKGPEEWGQEVEHGRAVRPYFDATLRGDRALYRQFVKRLWGAGLIRFGRRCQVQVIPFFHP